ncbi:MAG: hypothetical protein IPO48_06410 [Saprospiraceae bacterium]|nr:hypothetical protein [Saprospiraceae bacterium]
MRIYSKFLSQFTSCFTNLLLFVLFIFFYSSLKAQCPANYTCNATTGVITFQFDAGNASADRNVACDFVRKLGGTGTDPCSGGFFIVNGVRFDYTSNSGGANGGNSPITLTFTATTLPLTCPTNFQIAEAIGCAYSTNCLDVYFEDSVTGQNCSSSNSFLG